MAGVLSRFRIEKLHGTQTMDISIEDNKIILVGENGTGKSTVANFIYFLLTHQWRRLSEYNFNSILAIIDSIEIRITNNDLVKIDRSEVDTRISPVTLDRLNYLLRRERFFERAISNNEIISIAQRYHLSPSILVNYVRTRSRDALQSELPFYETSTKMGKIDEVLNKLIKYQVLYLPTYRRIERDLRSIFRGLESEVREIQERQRRLVEHAGYIEFVEFGMEDVERAIQQKMGEIKDNVRNGLSKLTGTYLRDVISGTYKTTDLLPSISELDESTINAIFARIPPEFLPEKEQKTLRRIIKDIIKRDAIQEKETVIAHFLSQLISLHREQQEQERNVREFVDVCNRYLKPNKEIIYDNVLFEIYIHKVTKEKNDSKISLRDLSSGEKQIVSLFSHVYLSGVSDYFLIIDEPELSLSVPWQKKFLPDLFKTGLCKGLVAATHSPFIYDNNLEKYTKPLEDFMEVNN